MMQMATLLGSFAEQCMPKSGGVLQQPSCVADHRFAARRRNHELM